MLAFVMGRRRLGHDALHIHGGHAYGLGRPHQAILTDAAPLLLVAGIT
jgi:hypothetical protein